MGGKRNQKKKKKKSWRAMLDGCFHKPVFDRKDSQDSKDSSQDSRADVHENPRGTPSAMAHPHHQHPSALPSPRGSPQVALPSPRRPPQIDPGSSQRSEGRPLPVRGILKKSPTSSSMYSAIFPESNTSGLVYYNPIYSDVSSKGSSNPQDSESASSGCYGYGPYYHGAVPQHVYARTVRQQAVSYPSTVSEQPDTRGSGQSSNVHGRQQDGGRQIAESWEDWKAEYLEGQDVQLRQRQYAPQGLLRHNLDNYTYEDPYQQRSNINTTQPKNTFVRGQHQQQQRISPNENRWSFPITDLRHIPGAKSISTTSNSQGYPSSSSTRPSGVYSNPVSPNTAKDRHQSSCRAVVPYSEPSPVSRRYQSALMLQQQQHHYQQQQEQPQQQQHHQQHYQHLPYYYQQQMHRRQILDTSRDNHQIRPISAPASSWQNISSGPPIMSQNRSRHYSENDPTYKDPAHYLQTNASPYSRDHQTDIYGTRSSPGSRLYDPIRKPMGSHFCPYSNPIYGVHGPVSMDKRSQSRAPQPIVNQNAQQSFPQKESTGYNVSHIYATVCRTDSKSIASSCIYTSYSWQQKTSSDAVPDPPPIPDSFQPILIPPPLPPPMMPLPLPLPPRAAGVDYQEHHSSHDAHRPPLPSYDDVVRYRHHQRPRCDRPNSWSEADLKETERKRDAFMTLLAKRYPQYADRIQGGIPASSQAPTGGAPPPKGMAPVEKPARSRDPQRRRAGPAVVYDPRQATNTFEYEDLGTMSDLELPSFQRGGFTRTSLPIVRSASTSLERPLGLIFLVYGSQTKKSLLPNELTTLDTVRAMFVRAFPDLTMEMMELPRKKIYVLDPATNIYFQLEDLGEVKDRSVLKLHETDDGIPQKVRERQEIRGRTVQVPLSRAQSHQDNPEYSNKSHTLPAHATPGYSDQDQWNARDRARSRTPEPMERQRSLSAGASSRQRYPHSPEGFTPADRSAGGGSLNPIPENRQVHPRYRDPSGGNGVNNANGNNNYYETIGGPHSPNSNYSRGGYPAQPQPQSHYDRENPYAIYAAPPQQQAYIARSTRASTMAHPQRAIGPPSQPDSRDGSRGANPSTSRHSPAFAHGQQNNGGEPIYQRSQSYRPPATEKDVEFTRSSSTAPEDHFTSRNRIEKMEQQLASLTAWVHYQKSDLPGGGVHRNESMKGPRSVGSTTSDSSDTFPASSASKYSEETSPTSISSLPPTNHVVYATPTTTTTQGLSDIHDGQRPMIGISNNNATISPVSPPPPLTPPSSSPAAATTITSQALSAPPAGAPTSSSTVIPMVPADIGNQVTKLKSDLQVLRRQTQLNVEAMREEFMKAANSIKVVISSVPGAENQVNFHNRVEATKRKTAYLSDKVHVDQELGDLESSVEELRYDILNHQCRVQLSDVEGMALLLSNITKNLADLKAQFPEVQGKMTDVMKSEMILVKAEENFLIEEPSKIEKSLMRCKKLTGTLYTLKRLASVQDHHPPQIPNIVTSTASSAGTTEEDPKKTLLENIRALVPDHDRRVQKLEAREAARQRMKKLSTQKDALKFGKSLEMASKGLRPCSTSDDRQQEGVEVTEPVVTASNEGVQEAPMVVSSQNTISANPTPLHNNYFGAQGAPVTSSSAISSTGSSSSRPTVTFSDPPSSSLPPSSSSTPYSSNTEVPLSSSSGPAIKPFSSSYSASLSTTSTTVSGNSNKQASEKPTATVSAMPAHTSVSTNLQSPPKHTHVDNNSNTVVIPSSTSNVKSASIPLTEMTERLSSQVQAGTGPATHSVSTGTDSSKKSDASVSTTSSTASATTSSFRPPVFTKPPRQFSPAKTSTFTRAAPLVETEDFDINVKERPKSSGAPYPTSPNSKTPPISKANSLDSSPTKPYRPLSTSSVDTNGRLNGHAAHDNNNSSKDEDKVNKPYRKAARSAFSSAWVSPPSSPTPVTSPKTNPLPLQTINSMAQITPGGTINLVLSGVASPKSPTNPGTFTITPPTDITTDSTPNPSTPSCTPTSATVSPKSDSDTPSKQKKVPPPPPPRKGSRPTSMTSVDLNGAEQQQQLQEQQEMPQFVGGILGQHRLSGGPLSSTPKPASQQKALSTFEKDLASGIYANLNRPEFQSQNTSPQQLIDKANSNKKANNGNAVNVQANVNPNGEPSGPLAPMVSSNCIDRTERGSSSESTSSSNSGTSSMGSQQSVAGVMRSASVNLRSSSGTKPKPEPPKRHSSLLSKSPITPPDTRVPTRRKTLNGVDL